MGAGGRKATTFSIIDKTSKAAVFFRAPEIFTVPALDRLRIRPKYPGFGWFSFGTCHECEQRETINYEH